MKIITMKGLHIISCLATLLQIGSSQELVELGNIDMLDTSTRKVQVGAEVEWSCVYHEEIFKVMSRPIEFYHEFIWNGEEKRVLLFVNNNRQKGADPDVWSIEMDISKTSDKDLLTFKVQLKAATAKHNGRFLCEMGEQSFASDIVVYEDLKVIEMTLNGQVFSDDSKTPIELELADPLAVHCRVLGANPGAKSVHILVDGKFLDTGNVTSSPLVAATPQFMTQTGTGEIIAENQHEGAVVACEARGPGPDGNMLRASATLVTTPRSPAATLVTTPRSPAATLVTTPRSPAANCSDADAYPGMTYSFMKCLKDGENVTSVITCLLGVVFAK